MTDMVVVPRGAGCAAVCGGGCAGNGTTKEGSSKQHQNHLSLVALILAALRKSMAACRVDDQSEESKSTKAATLRKMEIGWPTDVQHLTHVTFDRFHGFLGLPVEFEVEIPCRAPSASVSVFGVSAESMQCSYDSRGNSVPTILLLMQERLYAQGGLKVLFVTDDKTRLNKLSRAIFDDEDEAGIHVFCTKTRSRASLCPTLFPLLANTVQGLHVLHNKRGL